MRLIATVLILCSAGLSRQLLSNGNFELPPDSGWTQSAWGEFTDTGNCRVRWRHAHNGDRDFELMVHKMLNKGFRLDQRVELPTLDVGFRASARLTSKTENLAYYAAAAVCLEYLDERDSVLGETRIYSATTGCPWSSGPRLHLIGAPDSLNWHEYSLMVQDELGDLPGVDPDSVVAVNLVLLTYVDRNG